MIMWSNPCLLPFKWVPRLLRLQTLTILGEMKTKCFSTRMSNYTPPVHILLPYTNLIHPNQPAHHHPACHQFNMPLTLCTKNPKPMNKGIPTLPSLIQAITPWTNNYAIIRIWPQSICIKMPSKHIQHTTVRLRNFFSLLENAFYPQLSLFFFLFQLPTNGAVGGRNDKLRTPFGLKCCSWSTMILTCCTEPTLATSNDISSVFGMESICVTSYSVSLPSELVWPEWLLPR